MFEMLTSMFEMHTSMLKCPTTNLDNINKIVQSLYTMAHVSFSLDILSLCCLNAY